MVVWLRVKYFGTQSKYTNDKIVNETWDIFVYLLVFIVKFKRID